MVAKLESDLAPLYDRNERLSIRIQISRAAEMVYLNHQEIPPRNDSAPRSKRTATHPCHARIQNGAQVILNSLVVWSDRHDIVRCRALGQKKGKPGRGLTRKLQLKPDQLIV